MSRTERPDDTPSTGTSSVAAARPDVLERLCGKSTVVLAVLLGASLLFVFREFALGNRLLLFKDVGSDTINAFYPRLLHVADYLATEGLPGWSFSQGMGQSVLPGTIGDPFKWILYALGRDGLAYGLAWVELLKLFLAGMLFHGYLRALPLSRMCAIAGGILYPFSGFLILGSGWYVFSTQGVYLALLLWGFERLFSGRSWWMFTLSVCLFSLNQPFDLYLAALLLLCYCTLRQVARHGWSLRGLTRLYLTLFLWGLLGVVMSSALLVSSVQEIVDSPRGTGGSSRTREILAQTTWIAGRKELLTVLGRLFSNDFFHGGEYELRGGTARWTYTGWKSYFEAPAAYCGLSTLLLLPQAFLVLDRRRRRLAAIGLLLVLAVLLSPLVRKAVWFYSGHYYRTLSLFVSLGFLLPALYALNAASRGKVDLRLLAVSAVVWLLLMFVPFARTSIVGVDHRAQAVLAAFLVLFAIVIAAMRSQRYRSTACVAFLVLVPLEAVCTGSWTYSSRRRVVTKDEFREQPLFEDATLDALAWMRREDPELFYRVEKLGYQSGKALHGGSNDAMAQGYSGSSSYYSFNQSNYIRFLAGLDVIDANRFVEVQWAPGVVARPLLQIITSTRYQLVEGDPPKLWHEEVASFGDVKVWRSTNFVPFGFTYDKVLDEATFQRLSNKATLSTEKQIALLKAMVLAAEDVAGFPGLPRWNPTGLDTDYSLDELASDVEALRESTLTMTEFSQNHVAGSVRVDRPKALFFSLPFDRSWSAEVDGEPARLFRANMGLTALPLAPGAHTIELRFTPPYWRLSILASIAGCVVFVALLAWTLRRPRPSPSTEP